MIDRYLYGHVNKSYVIESKAHCEHKCYLDADCMSTNTKILRTGKFLCELNVLRTDVVKQDSLKKDITAYVQPDLLDNSAT
ncbi:hypothetical protein P5673_002971, partial [Acropora cervicornis]